jgi:hypothetical protein
MIDAFQSNRDVECGLGWNAKSQSVWTIVNWSNDHPIWLFGILIRDSFQPAQPDFTHISNKIWITNIVCLKGLIFQSQAHWGHRLSSTTDIGQELFYEPMSEGHSQVE